MKKYLHSLAAAMILILPLASCDKDNNSNEPDPTPTPTPTTPTAQLSSIEETSVLADYDAVPSRSIYKFEYNDLNIIKRIRESDFDSSNGSERVRLIDFGWDPFSFTVSGRKFKISLSPAGFIAFAKEEGDSEYYTFEYDEKGHLIREMCLYENIDDFEETLYIWKDGLLTEIEERWRENAYGTIYTGTELITISYGNEQNKTGVWPASFWECELIWFEPGNCNCPYVLQTGLLGTAPTRLPISVKKEYISGNSGKTSVERYKIAPKLDSQGRLSSEFIEETDDYGKYTSTFKYTYR